MESLTAVVVARFAGALDEGALTVGVLTVGVLTVGALLAGLIVTAGTLAKLELVVVAVDTVAPMDPVALVPIGLVTTPPGAAGVRELELVDDVPALPVFLLGTGGAPLGDTDAPAILAGNADDMRAAPVPPLVPPDLALTPVILPGFAVGPGIYELAAAPALPVVLVLDRPPLDADGT